MCTTLPLPQDTVDDRWARRAVLASGLLTDRRTQFDTFIFTDMARENNGVYDRVSQQRVAHWCTFYKETGSSGAGKVPLYNYHRSMIRKFMRKYHFYGIGKTKDGVTGYAMGARCLKEVGGCDGKSDHCKKISRKVYVSIHSPRSASFP